MILSCLNSLTKIEQTWPGAVLVGPDANDDAAVMKIPGTDCFIAAKMEATAPLCSHLTTPRLRGRRAMRDVVAMGARPIFLLDFIGTRPLEQEVIVGPCGFEGKCTCGKCETMTSQDRINIMIKGMADMCETMGVFVVGGGFSTSFSDIVPAMVVAIIGKQVTERPLTKPAKSPGDKIIIIGETDKDGNDTLYRAGLVEVMQPALALFAEERTTMEATLSAFATGKIKACSDLGAGGIGAAVCESARYGGLGARINLDQAPVKAGDITPEEIFICETQSRMLLQVEPQHVEEVLEAIRAKSGIAAVIGEITDQDHCVFEYKGQTVATIPNKPLTRMQELLAKPDKVLLTLDSAGQPASVSRICPATDHR